MKKQAKIAVIASVVFVLIVIAITFIYYFSTWQK